MADTNGSGRLDRIEAALEHLVLAQVRDHEERQRDFKQLMTWQVLMQDKMEQAEAAFQRAEAARQKDREEAEQERQRLNELNAITDKRIAELVRAIMRLVPPAA